MSGADWSATSVLVGTIVVFTVLFDLVDIRPQVGAFRFVATSTYAVYLGLRLFLALAAAALVAAAQPQQPPVIVGILAVLTGVVLLQGLALKIAGQDVVNVANLVEVYKDKMIQEEARRTARALEAEILRLADDLYARLPEAELRNLLRVMLFQAFGLTPDPAGQVNAVLAAIDTLAAGDSGVASRLYAGQIAQTNPEYVRVVLDRPRPDQPGAASTDRPPSS